MNLAAHHPLRRRHLLLVLGLALLAPGLQAQDAVATGALEAIVRDREGTPVPDVQFYVAERAVWSDDGGRARFVGLAVGTYTVNVRRIGFPPREYVVDIEAGKTARLEVTLGEQLHRLDAMRVLGQAMIDEGRLWALQDFEYRRRRGVGRFITRQQLEVFHSVGTAIMAQTPGTRAVRGLWGDETMTFTRCSGGGVAYFVDGLRVSGTDILGFYRPNDLEAVEVYRSISELPPEAIGDACAAVFLWLRRS